MKRTMMAACILSLVACGGSKDDVATDQQRDWESQRQSLVYSFPDQGQLEVPVPSPVVLRFSSPVAETAPAIELREVGGAVVSDVALEWVDGKRGLIITPQNKLKPLTDYVVDVPAIELEKGEASARSIQFTTRALHEGPRSLVARDTFEVVRTIPDGVNFAVTDFASFRLQFSQPLDPSTVKYGDAGDSTVQLMGPDGLVDAHLLVSGPYITIDPKEDLTPGGDYSLNITGGLASVYGDNLTGGSLSNPMPYTLTATPVDTTSPTTGERVSMVQDIADTGEISPLTGKPINLVPMASVLLGEETATQASGTLAAELAFVPNFPDQTPLRIKRGSLIEGASIDVLIGGEVPAGFESGAVRMDFLSDATGYLLPNEYSNTDDAPRQVRLWMDVAVSTETPAANGAITQDLLHIELVGTSIVEDGQMVINAVGVVEPNVLASERATGVLSFYMKAYEDQDNPPAPIVSSGPLEIQSWSHFDTRAISVTDPIVINFNKAIDPGSVDAAAITLTETSLYEDRRIDVDVSVRGSALVIQPREYLRQPYLIPEGTTALDAILDPVSYSLGLNENISDIQGESLGSLPGLDFEFAVDISVVDWFSPTYAAFFPGDFPPAMPPPNAGFASRLNQSPVLLTAYPGYPCALDESELDLAAGIAGRCDGTLTDDFPSLENDPDLHRAASDLLPISTLAANMPIVIQATRALDPKSVVLGSSFLVQELDEFGDYVADVDGELRVEGARITFIPSEGWGVGKLYHYIARSNGDNLTASEPICDGSQAICDLQQRPLKTKLYHATPVPLSDRMLQHSVADGLAGGPDMRHFFRATEASNNVLQSLVASSVDANANFYHDVDEELPPYQGTRLLGDHRRSAYSEESVDISNPDPLAHPLDHDGVAPIPNSAKILSSTLWYQNTLELEADGSPAQDEAGELVILDGYPFLGLNVGCGYIYPDIQDMNDPLDYMFKEYVPLECPEKKFTHLHGALNAEVTGEYVSGKGIKVLIWPGQIVGTSILMHTLLGGIIDNALDSGKQVMRMRYAKDDETCVDTATAPCLRTQPITGWIREVNGKPNMVATVDVHIDAAALGETLNFIEGMKHNMLNVPITLDLEGEVRFNENGQMVIDQVNKNEVSFKLELSQDVNTDPNVVEPKKMSDFELILPAGGSYLQFVSDIIK